METNIEFVSNVYPIKDSTEKDKNFLSQISDFNKLKELNNLYFRNRGEKLWSEFQKKVMKEVPVCAIDPYKDPSWGILKNGNEYTWGCKCVNLDCKLINECRDEVQYEEWEKFSPLLNEVQNYEYVLTKSNFEIFPVQYQNKRAIYNYSEIKNTYKVEKEENTKKIATMKEIKVTEIIEKINTENTRNLSDHPIVVEIIDGVNSDNEFISTETVELVSIKEMFNNFQVVKQKQIIETDSSDVLLIDAGPGTGKTHTLIEKINYMVSELDVDPEGIVVLCFTNAAVDEIKVRLKKYIDAGGVRGLANVDVRTFHSFAWWIIGEANEFFVEDGWLPVDMKGLTYDSTIDYAIKLFEKFGEEIVENWEHFIVDELQDLTEHRAKFVLEIANQCMKKCGMTLLGDYCQAIYDYTVDNKNPLLTSAEFYLELHNILKPGSELLRLTENHRQTDILAKTTEKLREAIISEEQLKMTSVVKGIINDIPSLDKITEASLNTFSTLLKSEDNFSLLFRSNADTLKMSSYLRKVGIEHRLNIEPFRDNFAPWIADMLLQHPYPKITYEEFVKKQFINHTEGKNIDPAIIWKTMQEKLKTTDNVLIVGDLLETIRSAKADDPVFRVQNSCNLVVSNIHRSKGREYEAVVLDTKFAERLAKKQSDIGEYKTLYVALTRARSILKLGDATEKFSGRKYKIYKTGRNRAGFIMKKQVKHLEFKSYEDISPDFFTNINPSYMSKVCIGDRIELKRILEKSRVIKYSLIHYKDDEPTDLGEIKSNYIEDLYALMKNNITSLIDMPSVIDDLYVSGVYSRIADEEDIKKFEDNDIDIIPVWKWLEISGIGHARYDVY